VITAFVAAATLVAWLTTSTVPSGADAIADKRAEAAKIARQLDALSAKVDQLGQQYDAAQVELDAVGTKIAAAQKDVDAANRTLARARQDLANYAISAFVGGNDSSMGDILLTGKGSEVVPQVEYLQDAAGDRDQLIDAVNAAQYQTHQRLDSLQSAKDKATSLKAELVHEKDQADAAIAEQQRLQASVTGELAHLVAQAQAAAAAAAQHAAMARQTPPVTNGTGGGSGGGTGGPPTTTAPGHGGGRGGGTTTTTSPGTTTTDPGGGGDGGGGLPQLPIPPGNPPAQLAGVAKAITIAKQYLGTPYVWGGDSPSTGFDCSGLVYYSYGQAGISLPRVADAQAAATWHVTYANALPGDLVFFDYPDVGHVGIYLGGGMMLDAPKTGDVVKIQPIWWSGFVGFGRVV
jgi:cell wall-associated NlpC family hydrolase